MNFGYVFDYVLAYCLHFHSQSLTAPSYLLVASFYALTYFAVYIPVSSL